MKKKIVLTVLLGVGIILTFIAVCYTIHFIIRQSDPATAYFYESRAADGRKFNSFQEYIDYQNNGGEIVYSTTKSVVVASLILISQIISGILSVVFILKIWGIIHILVFNIQEHKERTKTKKEEKIKQKILKLENKL